MNSNGSTSKTLKNEAENSTMTTGNMSQRRSRAASTSAIALVMATGMALGAVTPAFATLDNTATVNGTLPNTNPAYSTGSEPSDTVNIPVESASPSYTATKAAVFADDGDNDGVPEVGETINFTVTLTNTGNVTLTPTALSDAGPAFNGGGNQAVTVPAVGSPTSESGTVDGIFSPGEVWTYSFGYTLTQTDIDAAAGVNNGVQNTAAVTVQYPSGTTITQTNPATDLTASLTLALNTDMTIDKEAYDAAYPGGVVEAGPVAVNDIIYYRFTVTNNSNVTISGITIDESAAFNGNNGPLAGPLLVGGTTGSALGGTVADLAPGQTAIFEVNYTVNQADIDTLQ